MILGGPHQLLQTIYIDDTDALEAVTIDETSGKIAACGGPDVFVYQPYGIKGETLKVRGAAPARGCGMTELNDYGVETRELHSC